MTEKRESQFFYGYVIVFIAFFFGTLAWGSLRTLGVFLEPLISEFGWLRATVSLAFTVCMIFTGLVGIAAGRLTDRFGPRAVMAASGFFLGLGYGLMSQMATTWQLYLYYGVVVAIGMSGVMVPMTSTVARWFVRRRGLMTGIVMAGPAFGITTVPLIASWLISSYGWRTTNILMGVVALVLIIVMAQFLKRDPSQIGKLPYGEYEVGEEKAEAEGRGFSLREAIVTRQFWMLAPVSFGNFFSINVVMVHIVIHATGAGISPLVAVSILSITAAISIGGRVIAGGVADRIGRRLTSILGIGLTLVAFICLLAGDEVWLMYLFAVLFGLGGWAFNSVQSPLVAELFGMRAHGVILGLVAFAGTVGGAAGPLLAGYVFDVMGSYRIAFLICGILSITGIVLISLLKPTSKEGAENKPGRST